MTNPRTLSALEADEGRAAADAFVRKLRAGRLDPNALNLEISAARQQAPAFNLAFLQRLQTHLEVGARRYA